MQNVWDVGLVEFEMSVNVISPPSGYFIVSSRWLLNMDGLSKD